MDPSDPLLQLTPNCGVSFRLLDASSGQASFHKCLTRCGELAFDLGPRACGTVQLPSCMLSSHWAVLPLLTAVRAVEGFGPKWFDWSGSAMASLRRPQQLLWERGRLGRAGLGWRSYGMGPGLPTGDAGFARKPREIAAAAPLLYRRPSKARSFVSANAACTRHYASSTPTEPGITSTTREHSPGHNVATLAVSNPAKLNIVDTTLLSSLRQKCQDLATDPDLRAVVLTGAPTDAGKAASFIGGADIKEMIALSSSEEARTFIDSIHHACEALRAIPVPVIAKVDGFCLGAGMEIAAACDLRVATEQSVFGMPEVKVGIPSVIEAAYLPGLIGMGRTRRLLYLAESIDAVTAERWGFVEEVVDGTSELDRVVEEWVGMLVGMGPRAIRSQKRLMQVWEEVGVREGIEAGAVAYAEAFADGGREPREFMGRFMNRRRE